MRRRLAASFVLLALSVLLLAGAVRAWSVVELIREQETDRLQREAQVVAAVLAAHQDSGRVVGEPLLTRLVGPATRLEYVDPSGESTVVFGEEFESGEDDLAGAARSDAGTVRLATGGQKVADLYARELDALLVLFLVVSLLAGLAGWYGARRLAEPFRALAGAAAALGRGRFDLSLPATRIPEARAIGQALERSASQLEGRLLRERAFTEYASHQLRTPLTSLLLELEELTLRPDVSPDVKEAAGRCMQRVDAVNAAAGELVSLSRQGALVEGGQVVLRELTGQITQTWANRLADARRTVTVESTGELDHGFTPGPIEHILELVLDDVAAGEGPVRLAFEGSPVHLRITLPAGVAGRGSLPGVETARGLAHAQGGRVTGDLVGADLEILLPRR